MTVDDAARMVPRGPLPAPIRPDPAMQALKEAAAAKLRAICEQAISIPMLVELAQLAQLVKAMLMVTEGPKGVGRRMGGFGSLGAMGYDAPLEQDYGVYNVGDILTPVGGNAETFGAKMIREVIGATKENNSSKEIGNLVEALRNAVEGKLGDDIVVPLRAQLQGALKSLELQVPEDDEPPHHGVMLPANGPSGAYTEDNGVTADT